MTHCGHCHDCGTPLRTVLDGEEWCDKCGAYWRYSSHGWPHTKWNDESEGGHCTFGDHDVAEQVGEARWGPRSADNFWSVWATATGRWQPLTECEAEALERE